MRGGPIGADILGGLGGMESWMGRMDTLEMERIDHVTMPLYPPPCQDHEFPISRKLKDLEGGGLFWDKHAWVGHGFGGGTWDWAGCPVPASRAFLTCSSLNNQVVLALSLRLALPLVSESSPNHHNRHLLL